MEEKEDEEGGSSVVTVCINDKCPEPRKPN